MYENIIELLNSFENTMSEEYGFYQIDRNSSAINSCTYASYSGKMELIQNIIIPTIVTIKDVVLSENDKYLKKCAEINIIPEEDDTLTLESLKSKPLDVTDDIFFKRIDKMENKDAT